MKYLLFFIATFFLNTPMFAEESTTMTEQTGYLHDVVHMLITLMLLLIVVAGTLFY